MDRNGRQEAQGSEGEWAVLQNVVEERQSLGLLAAAGEPFGEIDLGQD